MKYNSELQFIDNSDKAYILGLFYADGCVGSTNGSCTINGLEITHNTLFQSIITKFPFFSVGKHSITSAGNTAIILRCSSVLLKSHLISHGVLPRKSYENKNATFLPVIDPKLYSSFMRGFFDGDGYIVQNDTRNKFRMGIGGVNAYLMCDILKLLHANNIALYIRVRGIEEMNSIKKKYGILSKQEMYYIESLSFEETRKFMEYIYKEGDLLLQYKRDQAVVILDYAALRNEEINSRPCIPCPSCNYPRCTYNGSRGKVLRQRMTCSRCKKRFTIDLPNIAPDNSNIISAQDQLAHQELGCAA